jgi:hypothetical protein
LQAGDEDSQASPRLGPPTNCYSRIVCENGHREDLRLSCHYYPPLAERRVGAAIGEVARDNRTRAHAIEEIEHPLPRHDAIAPVSHAADEIVAIVGALVAWAREDEAKLACPNGPAPASRTYQFVSVHAFLANAS